MTPESPEFVSVSLLDYRWWQIVTALRTAGFDDLAEQIERRLNTEVDA